MADKKDIDFSGRLVYLTRYLEKWYTDLNPQFIVPITNRLAKVVKIFDWDTEEGKLLLELREKTGKWTNLVSKDFKYVLKVYYPDLILKDKTKITTEELVPQYFPGTQFEMFCLLPDWMVKDINKEEKNIFKVVKKDVGESDAKTE
jgi:hypothetical protein